jgi:hypothetical protein
MTEHDLSTEILVAGGGPAGFNCALAAARCGAKVILCQDRSVLGGNASSEVRMHMVGADGMGERSREGELEAREGGIIEEIRLEACVENPQRAASMLDLSLYDRCRCEPNLTLLLNTTVIEAKVEGKRIMAVEAVRHSTEDRFKIKARTFIDCTGDGRLGVSAGATYSMGREGKDAYGESLAVENGDNKTLASTLLFQARKHDHPMPFKAPAWARKFTEEELRLRPHANGGADGGLEYGYWWVEWGGQLDTIKDNEQIRDELLAILFGVWDHIKNSGDHGAENWALEWFGFLPGKRESRRFLRQYVLTENDLMAGKPFEDAIAYGGWPIDTHPPEGVDAPDQSPCSHTHLPWLYDIPLRACVARDLENLMFAGRNISASHIGFASTRVMATCSVIGQGVGTAAALGLREGELPARIAGNAALMKGIQQRLLQDDAYLIGIANEDAEDLARLARVSATSEQAAGPASDVLSGYTRAMEGRSSVPQGRHPAGLHRWMSDPQKGFPADIELVWPQPVNIGRVQLVFDTGLHRLLTLTHADRLCAAMHWGSPQPETVRDYILVGLLDDQEVFQRQVSGNYQRLNRHSLDTSVQIDKLVVRVTGTNGIDHARICEIRAYGSGHI